VALGLTETELPVTLPIPEIGRAVALVVVQLRAVDLPPVTVAGEALKEPMAGGIGPKSRARRTNCAVSSNEVTERAN
jgi:hypothetical protein